MPIFTKSLTITYRLFPIPSLRHFILQWRRGRDSNPRRPLSRSGFQDRRNRPLCHLSGVQKLERKMQNTELLFQFARSSVFILHSSICILHFPVAGREGIEPPTNGFGDRYSTN